MSTPIIVPIRHHSPACARLVRDLILLHQPRVVLIEGPSDASPLISALTELETRPPVALMAYFKPSAVKKMSAPEAGEPEMGTPDRPSLFYPFCDYSPEWVALKEGTAIGADVRFCDVPAGPMLDRERQEPARNTRPELGKMVAGAFGFKSHEEWWEALVEGRPHPPGELLSLLFAYGAEVTLDDATTLLREKWMWRSVEQAIESGVDPGHVMIICGAAHAVRFPITRVGPLTCPRSAAVEFALTPYSYAHLSQRWGYGAGNRTPLLYQRAWEMGDLSRAVAASLVDVGSKLRAEGWDSSTADAISAYAIASQLAGLREKVSPGSDELTHAARAVWPSERAGVLERAIDSVLIGSEIGALGEGAGDTPLAADIYRRVRKLWRILDADEREERLRLTDPQEIEKSRLLHQLRVSGITFARLRDGRTHADAHAGIWKRYEVWVRAWTPETAITVAEASPLGATLTEVARQLLMEALAPGQGMIALVNTLLDAITCGLDDLLLPALQAVDAASVTDLEWKDLARTTARLARLQVDAALPEAVRSAAARLAQRLHTRACTQLLPASRTSDEASRDLSGAAVELHSSVLASSILDGESWWAALLALAADDGANSYLSGMAASLLQAQRKIAPEEFDKLLRRRLSPAGDAEEGAGFIEGILSLNRQVLLRSADLAAALNHYLENLPDERFLSLLPVIRRSFQGLSRSEIQMFLGALLPFLGAEGPQLGTTLAITGVINAVATSRGILRRLFDEGIDQLNAVRADIVSAGAVLEAEQDDVARELGLRMLDLAESSGGSPACRLLVAAWRAAELFRIAHRTPVVGPPVFPLPGLNFVQAADSESTSTGNSTIPQAAELYPVLVESGRATRRARVAVVAAALTDPAADTVQSLLPLLAHGDYRKLICRSFAARPEAAAIASQCVASRNPLIRLSGLEIAAAAAMADSNTPASDGLLVAVLIEALIDENLWPHVMRLLRKIPADLLAWLRNRGPDPAGLRAGSGDELTLARAARVMGAYPPAGQWLRSCLTGPDRLRLQAVISMVRLELMNESEARWSLDNGPGAAADPARLLYDLDVRGRSVESLAGEDDLVEHLDEVMGGAEESVVLALGCLLANEMGPSKKTLPLIELLGFARSPAAVPALSPFVASGAPLAARLAAQALGQTGSEQAVSCLIGRNPPRGSDADEAILQAMGRIGDLRTVDYLARRLAPLIPEAVLVMEIDALKAVGEPLGMVLGAWLDSASETLRAVAEFALVSENGPALDRWAAHQPAPARLRQLCARLLLPGEIPDDLQQRIADAAHRAGGSAVAILLQALQTFGPRESILVAVLKELETPSLILPLLRMGRLADRRFPLIVRMGDAAIPQLTAALREPESYVQHDAREALVSIGSPAALAAIEAVDAEGARTKGRKRAR